MQNINLNQIYDVYWNWAWGQLGIGIVVTALLAFFQYVRRGKDGWRWPEEPLRSGVVLFLALVFTYPIAGLLGRTAESPHPWRIYFSLCGLAALMFIIHRAVLAYHTRATDNARQSLARWQAATDIEIVFDRPSDPRFIKALTQDLKQSNSARVVTVGHSPLDEWTPLWETLSRFGASGGKIQIISDVPLRRGAGIVDYWRIPEVVAGLMQGTFAIDCNGPFYFGIASVHEDLMVARFDGRSSGGNSLASGVYLLINQLSRLVEGGLNHAVMIRAAASPAEYKEMILPLESRARRIDRLPKRIFVVFKSEAVVHAIAEQRYGVGSTHIEHYVEEHKERASKFYEALGRGMVCREIYNKSELIAYVRGRKHGRRVTLTRPQMEETLMRWSAVVGSQKNYMVGLTDTPLPFKYELVDGTHFVMHEAIGQNDEGRMNAFCVTGTEFCKKPLNDFEIIWNSIPKASRKPSNVAKWIETDLRKELNAL